MSKFNIRRNETVKSSARFFTVDAETTEQAGSEIRRSNADYRRNSRGARHEINRRIREESVYN